MKKLFTLLTMLIVGIGSMWGQTELKGWSYASSVTVGDNKLQASSLKAGDKIVFARKENASYYLTIDIDGCILGSGTNSFQSAKGLSVFNVGGSSDNWTFESAKDGYFFPNLNTTTWANRYCVKTESPAKFKFISTGDGDDSYYIQDISSNNYFDGDNAHFTAWNSAGKNSKYFIYSVDESEEQIWSGPMGELTNDDLQYLYKSPQITGSTVLATIRLTFKMTSTQHLCNGYPYVHLSEFYLYDKDGNPVDLTLYTASEIFSSNATSADEGSINCLNDGVTSGSSDAYNWYWHSAWRNGPDAYHYLEINAASIDADLSKFQIGYITRNRNCVPSIIEVTTTEKSASELIELVNADAEYTAAKNRYQLGSSPIENPVVGLKSYSVTSALYDAVTAETPDAATILAAYKTFSSSPAVALQAGKTYRIISAYPAFETHNSGDKKKKVIYSDGSGLRWEAIDVEADYFKSVWAIANVNGNTFTMFNLNDAGYPQAVTSNDTKTPISRNNANTCTLKSLGEGQYNITSNGSGNPFHCGSHGSGAGTAGDIVRWNDGKNSQSAWYIQEVSDITMPTTGYYRIRHGNASDDKYMQTTTDGLGAVATSNMGINTIFRLTKNEDGTYYLRGDNGRYVQEATKSSKVQMTMTPVKYFITRDKANLWNLRAQAATESDYDYHYLHTNNDTKVVGWCLIQDDNSNSRWTLAEATDYTYYPVELTGLMMRQEVSIP